MKRGQVWIETVIYTLIGLALIGLALSFIMPKINETKDKSIVEQTIYSLNQIDEKISNVLDKGAGNVRNIEVTIKKGVMTIEPAENRIYFLINGLEKPYTEPGIQVSIGRIEVLSEESQEGYQSTLTIDYSGVDLVGEKIEMNEGEVPYRISVSNLGGDLGSERVEIKLLN